MILGFNLKKFYLKIYKLFKNWIVKQILEFTQKDSQSFVSEVFLNNFHNLFYH